MIPNLYKPTLTRGNEEILFVKENVLSNTTCDMLIAEQINNLVVYPGLFSSLFSTSFHSSLLQLDHPIHAELQDVFKEIIDFFKIEVDLVEQYEVKKYVQGDHFGHHSDNYSGMSDKLDRKISVLIMLSEDYEGGDLNILGKSLHGKKGSIIAFPSFVPHSVSNVTTGERWSLVTWLWGTSYLGWGQFARESKV